MSTNMGNLEKLGILVIVILVVVVGVVAITPKSTIDERLMPDGQPPTETAKAPEVLEPVAGTPQTGTPQTGDPKTPTDPWPKDGAAPADQKKLPAGGTVAADPAAKPSTDLASAAPASGDASGFRTIKVRPNDTLATIAKRELGSAARYPEILKANPGLVATKLHKDQEIKIPVASTKPPSDEKSASATPSQAQPQSPSAAGPVESPAPASSADKVYVVKSGDTLSSIAGHEMGSKSRWAQLQKANDDVLHGSTALKIGMKLHIPAGEKSEKTSSTSSSTSSTSDPAPVASSSDASSAATGEHEYVVKSGDSLWLIAKNELGSEKLVGALRAANSDVLGSSDALKVGMKLKLPAK